MCAPSSLPTLPHPPPLFFSFLRSSELNQGPHMRCGRDPPLCYTHALWEGFSAVGEVLRCAIYTLGFTFFVKLS